MAQRSTEVRGAMNLVKLFEQYGDEDRARQCLEELRWPNGVRCPRCGGDKVKRIETVTYYRRDTAKGLDGRPHKQGEVRSKRDQFDCSCGYQFSVRVGTVFHDSHLPLWKWFLATYLMCESKKGISANQLKRTLDVSYETAWYLCHRIRSAMDEVRPEPLTGTVEVDETYVGGKIRGAKHRLDNKTMVVGALERGGEVRLRVELRRGSAEVLQGFINQTVSDDAEAIYTDSNRAYIGVGDSNTRHETVNHYAEEWVRGDVSTQGIESAWSLLKRSIIGSYHQLSAKHLQAYVDEFTFRFNNRENPYLFRDTLLRLLNSDALPYDALVH